MKKDDLIVGEKYRCKANDIVQEWNVILQWLWDGWSLEGQNVDGYYPCIVHEVIEKLLHYSIS